uniref:TPT domain-containing protein n=1 Tax=Heterorhabditis bacteriophora TaxID=37862 RepID=A0A1I7WMI8_HETBA
MRFLQTTASKSAVVYVGTTLFCSLLGKVVITRFFFDYPIVILMLQMATTLFIIELLRVTGALKMAPYSFEKGRQCFFPSVLLCIAQWLTVSSFEGIGLPSLESIKRLTPVFIAVGMASQHQRLDKNQLIGITTISMASFLAVNLEMNIDRFSLFYGLISCVLQAVAYIQFESLSQTFQVQNE